ncbi:MAG: ATP-binding protein [Spirochaetia bacterium]|jgi:two-component system nitrogen regulation sensor histidine kinase NtrY|nr:ATP-binding protein [Spirochaetia bacterium]
MGSNRNTKSAYVGLISIVSIYILLIILILIFANKVLLEIATNGSISSLTIIPLAMVLPIFLIATIIFNLLKLLKQRKKNQPGSNFKTRLLIFFTFITILSSIPQGILAVNFINSAITSWFSSGTEEALNGGLDIAIEYNRSSMEGIAVFRDSFIFENIILNTVATPDSIWRNIKGAFPSVSSISLFDSLGNEIFYKSKESNLRVINVLNFENNTVTRSKEGNRSILRTRKEFLQNGENIYAVLSILLPENFDQNARKITDSLKIFTRNKDFQQTFLLSIILFYTYFSLPIILLSILTSFLLSEEIIQPIAHLENAISRVVQGDYSYRILTHSKDDLANLVNSFNDMVSNLELSRNNYVHTEKITAWQEIAQRMAHEIKNPLTPIKLSAQRILKKYKNDPDSIESVLEPAVDAIINEVENLTQLLSEFKDFSRMPTPLKENIQLKSLVTEVSLLYSESYSRITLDLEGLENTELKGDRGQIQRVFSNLISNSFDAIADKGIVTIQSEIIRKSKNYYCRIMITDTGTGIDSKMKKNIFNPYFTTKDGGTGLGLPIIERIIADHKGVIWYESEKEVGTTFFIELPMEDTV